MDSPDNNTDESDLNNGKKVKTIHYCEFDNCLKSFNKRNRLIHHMRTHTGERPYACDIDGCTKTYTNITHLRRHQSISHENKKTIRIPCDVDGCSKEFSDAYSLKRHKSKFHNPDRKYAFQCTECGQGFHRKSQLLKHSYLHTGEYAFECDVCHLKCPTKAMCTRHKRTHIVYHCDCNKEFERWSELCAHKRNDCEIENKCDICSKVFKKRQNLLYHKKIHTSEDDKNIFPCPKEGCDHVSFYKKNLQQHIKYTHEGVQKKKIPCPTENCTAMFSKMQNLKKHLDVHNSGPKKTVIRKVRSDKGSVKISYAAKLAGVPQGTKLKEGNQNIEQSCATDDLQVETQTKLKTPLELEAQDLEEPNKLLISELLGIQANGSSEFTANNLSEKDIDDEPEVNVHVEYTEQNCTNDQNAPNLETLVLQPELKCC